MIREELIRGTVTYMVTVGHENAHRKAPRGKPRSSGRKTWEAIAEG
jgi:hypothetical protein